MTRLLLVLVALFSSTQLLAYTCNQRENVYTGGCMLCPAGDTVSSAFKKPNHYDCLACSSVCNFVPAVEKSADATSCGVLPPGTRELPVMRVHRDFYFAVADVAPYVAAAIAFDEVSERPEDRSPFAGRVNFGASLSPDQARRAFEDADALSNGRKPFDNGYRVVVESRVTTMESGALVRVYESKYVAPDGASVPLHKPLMMKLAEMRRFQHHEHSGVDVVEYEVSEMLTVE